MEIVVSVFERNPVYCYQKVDSMESQEALQGVSMGGQNKPCVASLRVKDNVSCHNSCFSSSSACRDSLFTVRIMVR